MPTLLFMQTPIQGSGTSLVIVLTVVGHLSYTTCLNCKSIDMPSARWLYVTVDTQMLRIVLRTARSLASWDRVIDVRKNLRGSSSRRNEIDEIEAELRPNMEYLVCGASALMIKPTIPYGTFSRRVRYPVDSPEISPKRDDGLTRLIDVLT